jgi:hypothetical protein
VFRHACNLGLEGIVSKRKEFRLPVRPDWLKIKNADTPAVKREAEEDWGRRPPDGERIVEHVAGVEDYQVALATYRAACQRWPGIPITLWQGARVIEDSRRLRIV